MIDRLGTFGRVIGTDPWRSLEALGVYRLLASIILLALSLSPYRPPYFGALDPALSEITLYGYLLIAAFMMVSIRGRHPNADLQCLIHTSIDLAVIGLLTYSSGGVPSGLAMLMLTPVAASSLILKTRWALIPAAMASLIILGLESTLAVRGIPMETHFTQAGILGVLLFIISMIGTSLSRRARESEEVAAQAETNVEQLARLNATIIQRMQAGVVVVDNDGRVNVSNRTAAEILGTSTLNTLRDDAPALWSALKHWLRAPEDSMSQTLEFTSGTTAWPVFTRLAEHPQGLTLIVLEDARRIAAQAQQIKMASLGQLTASVAHEIRNPLAAIRHAQQLLAEGDALTGADRKLLDIIDRQSARINKIVSDILGLSGKASTHLDSVDLRQYLLDLVREFQEGLHDSPGQIDIRAEAGVSAKIDTSRLGQALCNLWQNSILHADTGGEPLRVLTTVHVDPDNQRIRFEVCDNGAGVPPEVADQMFEPFFSTRHGGTGLGLFITRELCRAAGGQLGYAHGDTRGSGHFHITLPLVTD